MDKNKNRTDLLAAGRKKLQQYRKKKDGKGSKPSGKANKPDPDVITDESSSVAKSTKGKKQLQPAETPVQDSATELADSSNADVATPDLYSTSDLPIEASEADMSITASVPDDSNLDDAIPTDSSPKTVNIEENTESSYVHITPVDEFTQKAGESKAASGEDQVPDLGSMQEHDYSFSEPDNRTSLINLEGEERTQANSQDLEEQTTESDDFPVLASTNDDLSANNGDEDITLQLKSDNCEVNPVSLTQLAKALQNLNEDEFRLVMSARDSVNGGDLKNDGFEFAERLKEQLYINNYEKELIFLQLCEESNAQKEFNQHRLQWFNEKSSFSASISDIKGKNIILSEELANCRSELENFQTNFAFSKTELDQSSARIQELQIELEKSENQLANVSSELSDMQMKNENLNLNVSSSIKEKEDGILENEKLTKELMGFKSLMESLQVQNVNCKESLDLVMEEKVKIENEKESLVTELVELKRLNEQFVVKNEINSVDLLGSQQLVESLSSEIAKFENERTKLGEEINHLTVKNEETLTELTNLQVEYEKSMVDLKNGAHQLEQLTEENVTLNSTLETYKAKVQEFEEQKSVQEKNFIEDNSQHLTDGKLEEQINSLEETFIKNVILDEVMKQYVSNVEVKKSELLDICEELKQESIITKTKNSDLTEKLSSSESRIQELETIYRKLEDASVGSCQSQTDFGQSVTARVTSSVDQTLAMIHDLQGNLENALKNNTLLSDFCKEMTEKIKDLEGTNELASHMIHKVFDNLQKIVNNSGPPTQENEDDTTSEQLEHLEISKYDAFIDNLIMMLRERAQLESKTREYNLELMRRMKDLEELNKRCINPDFIAKLFEDIQHSVTLTDIKIKPDEPESSLESVVDFLINNLKFNQTKAIELQNEIEKLTVSIIPYEIESRVFKESLISAMEQLVRAKSEIQLKETELNQSEQRVISLREKLHIAVTKGKGLIQQRDGLKQNLTATSNELEKCLHELQLKDATIQENETKLKTFSEAAERTEALESELSYIRNSATALRESFLLKDSALQRIEEILEDLDLPEDFHARDIIDKIDWLAKSVTNSIPIDEWKKVLEPSGSTDDELRRNYEELQNKFYGLAEHNEMLEQSLMERNNLVQRFEEVLDKINMPQQLRSLEPEDRIEWLRVALLEANDRCTLLQQDVDGLQKVRESLSADLEESQKRLVDLESALKSITDEREQLSASLEAKTHDYDKICEKNALYETEIDNLQNKVGGLQLKLDENRVNEDDLHHIHGEIVRLQSLVKEIIQVPETDDFDSNLSDIQRLEGLLKQLADKHITELTHAERSVDQSNMHAELARKVEQTEDELVQVKDERNKHVEKSQSLVNEIEALQVKNQELQNLVVQEEQKTATVKEKLNVAVRKGKSLVQVRDSMKQTVKDLTSQVDRLTGEIKVRENTILEFQEKIKDLFTSQESIQNKDSEIRFLKNRLEEAESELQDNTTTLSMILTALGEIDLGFDLKTNDPIEKMKQIKKILQDLQDAISSAEQDSRKSKKAAELLLAEVNEIQERNEDLLEELSRITMEKDSAESQWKKIHLEERSSQFSELMNLKSGLDQLRPGLSKINNLLNDVFPKDMDHLYNLEATVKSLLESSDSSSHGDISARSASKVNVRSKLFLDSKNEQLHDDISIIDLWRFIGSNMRNLITNINGFEEKLQSHAKTLHEKVIYLSETLTAHHREITSHKSSIESDNKQKETENLMLRKYISVLYEACRNSVIEIEKNKGESVENDFSVSGEDIFSEECIASMVNRLLLLVKDFQSIQAENMDVNLKEMKSTISNLQKELTEKDVQKDRICVDLVNQIKRAEATAMSHLQELEPAKAQINDLKEQCKLLEQKVKELESQESVLVDLHEKVKSLTDALTAKEQENEALLQALDEEEAQMEDLTNKITKLEKLVQQKDLDLKTVEAARVKSLKKLSITMNKFDELHHLSETLVSEVDKLQSQLQERDSEISFLRDEITRCTTDSLQALETDKKCLDEIQDILTWLDSTVSGVEMNNMHHHDDTKINQVHEYNKEILKKQITSIISELKDLKQLAQNKDDQLHKERSKVDDLMRSLRDKESRLSDSAQGTSITSEIVEVEPVSNKWSPQGSSRAPQVRSLRKVNNDQLAISIDDVDSDDKDKLEDEDDDKAHGFKSLSTSKLVPRFTRPVTDFIDGLWVSCDRTLMRQPVLRLSLIFYWAVMHALLAVFVV